MIEVRKPASMSANDFSSAVRIINPVATYRVERRNKGKADDHYLVVWDDSVAPAPSEADILAQESSARVKRLSSYLADVVSEKVNSIGGSPVDLNNPVEAHRMLMRAVAYTRKESKGRPTNAPLLDALEAWFDSVSGVYNASDLIQADINAGTITTEAEIDSDVRWP